MIRTVECTSCSTAFPVDPRKVPDEGVWARCSVCSSVFFVEGGAIADAAAPVGRASQSFEPSAGGTEAPAVAPLAAPDPGGPAPSGDWSLPRVPEVDLSAPQVSPIETVPEPSPPPAPAFTTTLHAPVADTPRPAPAPGGTPSMAFSFGKRDPHEKASRLARVLVSDIITYNPERHQRALDGGTLRQDFEEEIRKSWGEYIDQVGKDIAESTPYFTKALNEILARGQQLF